METQRNTRTRLRNISYMCILKRFIIRKKNEWFTFSLNGKFLISISLIKEQPYKMTKPTSLLSLPMFYFFVLYKQWQRNLKLTSISNLKNFLGGRGVGSWGNVLWGIRKWTMERAFRGMDLSKHFIVNFQLIWTEGWTSGPDIIITIGTSIRRAIKTRVIIVSCIICNVDIMPSSKGWTIVIVVVCGMLIGAHVIFKVTISVIVFQRVYEGVGRGLVWPWRPWRETYIAVRICNTGP